MHSAMMMQGDPPTCCYAAAECKSIQVDSIQLIDQKVAIFEEKISKMSCQRSDLRKTSKYSRSRDLEGTS